MLPRYNLNDSLPAELAADVPTLVGHRFVLASPFSVPDSGNGFDTPYGYYVYTFGASSGTTERQAKSYNFSVTGPASFSLNFAADSTTAEVNFVNEESPGIWRVTMHATGPSSEQFFDGLLMETVGAAGGFSAANVPGNNYATSVSDGACGGPYALLDALLGLYNCGPPYFGWKFEALNNNVRRLHNNALWGVWQLPGVADASRLLFANPSFVASPILQIRGWELVRSDGVNDNWVLENVTATPDNGVTSAPPVGFKPTARLSHVKKQ